MFMRIAGVVSSLVGYLDRALGQPPQGYRVQAFIEGKWQDDSETMGLEEARRVENVNAYLYDGRTRIVAVYPDGTRKRV